MKITGIKIHHVEWERGPYHWRDGIMPNGPMARTALLRILTDEGIEGLSPYREGANIEEIKWQLSRRPITLRQASEMHPPKLMAMAMPGPGIPPALESRSIGIGSTNIRYMWKNNR